MINAETGLHSLSDDRKLAYCRYGDPTGTPVFYAHGSPDTRLEGAVFHEAAEKYGFCLISTDRPGFGQSSFKPNRKLLDYPKDLRELSDALGIASFTCLTIKDTFSPSLTRI